MQDLFNMDVNTGMDSLDTKKTGSNSLTDKMYRPSLKNAKDPKVGYRSRIRFLPNLLKNPTEGQKALGDFAIQKAAHYVNLPEYKDLNGYYDQQRNIEGVETPCPLYSTFWNLKNSKSVVDQENAQKIGYSTKWYSYVLVIEDENQPELEGKIMVYAFGKKIKDQIDLERTGQISGTPCNVFDLAGGKDFNLFIQKQGDFPDYSMSRFAGMVSSLTIKGKNVPTEDQGGRMGISQNFQATVRDFLLERDVELEDYAPKKWNDEQMEKVQRVLAIVTGTPVASANNQINNAATTSASVDTTEVVAPPVVEDASASSDEVDPDDFFNSI